MTSRGWLRIAVFAIAAALGVGIWLLLGADARRAEAPDTPPPPVARTMSPTDGPKIPRAPAERAPPAAAPAPAETTKPAAPDSASHAGMIEGVVSYNDAEDAPAADVLVVLARGPEGSTAKVAETRTDAEGWFAFEEVEPGEHSFSTRTLDEEPWDFEHETVRVEAGQPVRAELWVERPLPPGSGIRVSGTLTYDDGKPVETFHLDMHRDGSSHGATGRDGSFEIRLSGPGKYWVSGLRTDGTEREHTRLRITVVEGEPVRLVVPRPREVTLVVVDRETGLPLSGARAHARRWEEDDFVFDEHPNGRSLRETPLVAGGDGRIALGRIVDPTTWFVVAEGHAWRKVEVDGSAAEERVPLAPGGRLRVSIAGWSGLDDARVSITAGDPWRRWTLPDPGEGGQAVYEGIPPGAWKFTVRRGWDFKDGEVYGEGQVEVRAAEEAVLAIQTRPSEAAAPVPVRGTVVVPAAWRRKSTSLRFEGAEATNSSVERRLWLDLPADGSPVPFTLDPVPPGRYEVDISPQWYTTVEVPAAGGSFDFQLPGPGTLVVQVLDDASGTAVPGAEIVWHTAAGRSGYGLDSAEPTGTPGELRIVAPAGLIALTARAPGYVEVRRGGLHALISGKEGSGPIAVEEGRETRLTVRLLRGGTVRVVFKWEGDSPELENVWLREGRPLGGSGRGMSISGGKGEVTGVKPGSYVIQMSTTPEGFEDVEDVPVDVRAGEKTEVVIPLKRR